MAGGGIVVIAVTLVPLLSNLFAAGGGGGIAQNDAIRVAFRIRPSLWPVVADASGGPVNFTMVPMEIFTASLPEAAGIPGSLPLLLRVLPDISSFASQAGTVIPQGADVPATVTQFFII